MLKLNLSQLELGLILYVCAAGFSFMYVEDNIFDIVFCEYFCQSQVLYICPFYKYSSWFVVIIIRENKEYFEMKHQFF